MAGFTLRDPRDLFNFETPLIFLDWMKLHSLHLANASTMGSPKPGDKFPKTGVIWVM